MFALNPLGSAKTFIVHGDVYFTVCQYVSFACFPLLKNYVSFVVNGVYISA